MTLTKRFVLAALGIAVAVGCRAHEPNPAPASAPTTIPPPRGAEVAAPIDKNLPRPDPIARSAPIPGFMKGVNLGNGLDAPTEGAWGTTLTERHFPMAKAAGFDHVRLPVRFTTEERSDSRPPFSIKPEFFARVDWAVDQALAQGLNVIIDLHHFEEIHKEPNAQKERLYALWRQIAGHYASRPPQVAFEILNEPNGALEPAILNEVTAEALRIIRETNPTRLVFADPYFWASAERLGELRLPADDPNVVAEFHVYEPILFTHQGAPWMDPWWGTKGVIFPGPPKTPITPDPATASQQWVVDWFEGYNHAPPAQNPGGPKKVFDLFDQAARYVEDSGKRVYLGEFGAIDIADEQSRENYVWLVRTEAERRGIGWCYWDDGGSFKLMNVADGTMREPIRRALLAN